MYGAGWLERRNLWEYARAARLAADCRLKAASHPFARWLRVWSAPAPKEEIRREFLRRVVSFHCETGTVGHRAVRGYGGLGHVRLFSDDKNCRSMSIRVAA
jgi:hypothetical protein